MSLKALEHHVVELQRQLQELSRSFKLPPEVIERTNAIMQVFQTAIKDDKQHVENVAPMSGVFRHVKRGSTYTIDRVISVQNSGKPIMDGELLLVYEDTRTKAGYGRRLDEFNDGRFVRVEKDESSDEELPFWPGDI